MERQGLRDTNRSPLRTPPLAQRVAELRHLAELQPWDGLDSGSVAALLTDEWSGAGPLHLDETLALDDLGAPTMLHNVRAVLQAAPERGIVPEFNRVVRTGFATALGPVVDPLHWTGALAKVAGNAGQLYAHLFRTYFRTFNLAYTDRFPELPEIQDLVPYWLWVMTGPMGAGFAPADMYVQLFTPEPRRLDDAAAPARLRYLIQKRVLDALADFGLLEPKPGDDETEELGDVGFRPTSLFKRFLHFDLPPAGSVPRRGHLNLLR